MQLDSGAFSEHRLSNFWDFLAPRWSLVVFLKARMPLCNSESMGADGAFSLSTHQDSCCFLLALVADGFLVLFAIVSG